MLRNNNTQYRWPEWHGQRAMVPEPGRPRSDTRYVTLTSCIDFCKPYTPRL